jgi:hypothetical protein
VPTLSDVVLALRFVAVLFLVGAAWFAFRGTSTIETTQISPERCPSGYYSADEGLFCYANSIDTSPQIGSPIYSTARLAFGCATVWDQWVVKRAYTAGDGTTYPDLAGGRTPDDRIYAYDATLDSANTACISADHGRVHLFWTLVVLAGLTLIGSEIVDRHGSRAEYWEDEAPTSS